MERKTVVAQTSEKPARKRISGIPSNNKGSWCPFKPVFCQEGYCDECQIYFDWLQKRGEIGVIHAWSGKEMGRKPGLGETGIFHGLYDEYKQKYFPEMKLNKAKAQLRRWYETRNKGF